ncbi:glycerate kinase, partial [Chitinivorax tropicus]
DRTTAGVGRLIRHALERGATHIEVALGGSATIDPAL